MMPAMVNHDFQWLVCEHMRAKPWRHCPGDCQPVANSVAAIPGHCFEVFVSRVTGSNFGNLAALETLVDPAGLQMPGPMREAAGTENGDALVLWPSLDALAVERANVEASLGSRIGGANAYLLHHRYRAIPSGGEAAGTELLPGIREGSCTRDSKNETRSSRSGVHRTGWSSVRTVRSSSLLNVGSFTFPYLLAVSSWPLREGNIPESTAHDLVSCAAYGPTAAA